MVWLYWTIVAAFVSPVGAVVGWYVWFHTSQVTKLVNRLPGPKLFPFIGNSWDLLGGVEEILGIFAEKWLTKYGRLYRTYIGLRPHVVIASHELLQPVLSSSKLIEKGLFYDFMRPWLGDSLLTSAGPKWKERRQLLHRHSTFKVLDDFVETFNEQSWALCRKFQNLCLAQSCEIDIFPLMSGEAIELWQFVYQMNFNRIKKFHQKPEYMRAVLRVSQIILERFSRPWLRLPFLFALTPVGREHRRCLATLHGFTDKAIRHRQLMFQEKIRNRALAHLDVKPRRTFLDFVLEAVAAGAPLTDRDIRDEVEIFMFGGHVTTAAAASWFLYCMSCYPHHQDRVREELDEIFQNSDRHCTRDDAAKMRYLDHCIKESMRIYPPHPFIVRENREPIIIEGYEIPAGCDLLLLIYALHRNPEIFPDPEVFKPERFSPEQSSGRQPFAYIPFSAGPRDCIGKKFAILELKVVLSTLLRKFEFKLSPKGPTPMPTDQIVLKPVDGIRLLVSAL
nr:CYP4AP8 protein [Diaphanosoma celebensis]